MRIAVDAMGGDHAPGRPVDGALAAARHLGFGVDLVGRPDAIRAELARHGDADSLDVQVIAAPDVVEMTESPAQALRRFRRRADYSESGGAPLLGVNRVVVVGHGRSSVKAVRYAVAMAARLARGGWDRVQQEMAALPRADM